MGAGFLSPAAPVLVPATRRFRKTVWSEHSEPKSHGVHPTDKNSNPGSSQAQTVEAHELRAPGRMGQPQHQSWLVSSFGLLTLGLLAWGRGVQGGGSGWRLHCLPAWAHRSQHGALDIRDIQHHWVKLS